MDKIKCKTKILEVKLESLDPTGVPINSESMKMEVVDDPECSRRERLIIHIGDCLYMIDKKGNIIERLIPHE
jgi:hypothetical protein